LGPTAQPERKVAADKMQAAMARSAGTLEGAHAGPPARLAAELNHSPIIAAQSSSVGPLPR